MGAARVRASRRNSFCTSKDSGVVRSVGSTSLPDHILIGADQAHLGPAACSRMALSR